MPFEPELLTTEADETPLRQLQPVEPAREEHVEPTPAPEPPAEPSDETREQVEQVAPEEFGSPREMWEAIQSVDVDGLGDELAAAGLPPDQVEAVQDYFDQLLDLAEDDPGAAANLLGEMYAAQVQDQVRAETAETLRPMMAREYQAVASDQLTQLQTEFGVDVVEANKQELASLLASNPAAFLYGGVDAYGQPERLSQEASYAMLRQALQGLEYERQTGYVRGDDIKEGARSVPAVQRDGFGEVPRASRPAQAQPPANAQRQPAQQPAPALGSVHIEGGSTPPPGFTRAQPMSADDQIRAEIRGTRGVQRDMFGRVPALNPKES